MYSHVLAVQPLGTSSLRLVDRAGHGTWCENRSLGRENSFESLRIVPEVLGRKEGGLTFDRTCHQSLNPVNSNKWTKTQLHGTQKGHAEFESAVK